MYGCESWTIKKAERRRIDAFELWCWGRLLRVPWTASRFNQSMLKEISPEYSLEGLMLKLKLQYFGCLIWRTDSLEKTLMLAKIEGRRRRGRQRMRWLDDITSSTDMSLGKSGSWWWTGMEAWHAADHGVKESDMTEWLNWTELKDLNLGMLSVEQISGQVYTSTSKREFGKDKRIVHVWVLTLIYQVSSASFFGKQIS